MSPLSFINIVTGIFLYVLMLYCSGQVATHYKGKITAGFYEECMFRKYYKTWLAPLNTDFETRPRFIHYVLKHSQLPTWER